MTRASWLDPAGTRAAIVLSIAAAIVNGIWLLLDHSTPSWDQAFYLTTTLSYQDALDSGGPIELLRAIKNTDPSHGPLFTVLMLPLVYAFGPEQSSGLLLNLLIAPVLYFAAGEIAWIVFRNWAARLLTIVLVAAMPLMVGLFHNVLQDFLLVTLTTLSLLLLLKSDGFRRRGMTIAMAAAMGFGTLTKVTFPLFVIGPLLVVAIRVVADWVASRRAEREADRTFDPRRLAVNLGAAGLTFLVIAFAWYGPNFDATLDYVRSTTGGPLAEGAGPTDPFTFDAMASFTAGVINFNLSWVILLPGLLAVALSWGRLKALFRQPLDWDRLTQLAFLLAWAVIPFLSVITAKNQDVRLMAPAFPAVAILVAGAICAVRWRRARLALAGVTVVVLGYQTLTHITDVTPGFMPDQAKIEVGSHSAMVQLNSEAIGYEQLPGDDYGTPVIEYIEQVAGVSPGGNAVPRSVCLLQSEAIINSNTFRYLASAHEDPYVFVDVVTTPAEPERHLEEVLSGCNFALFVKPPPTPPSGPNSRLTLVNEPYAQHHMTPRLLRLFKGPSRSFPLASTRQSEGEAEYLDATGSDQVRVLVRTPGEARSR